MGRDGLVTIRDFSIVHVDWSWTGTGTSLSTSRNTYCACVTTWTYVHNEEDDAKSADFTSSSRVVNVRPRHGACAVYVHKGIG